MPVRSHCGTSDQQDTVYFFLRHTKPSNPNAPRPRRVNVDGSGTATTEAEFVTGEPASEGSKMKVAPAPTVTLVPSGRAVLSVMISVPASTVVPPLYVLL